MTVLLHGADLEARRHAASGPLHELADSLARDLEPVMARELFVPLEKARMTRRGGRCENDGSMLEFDPWSPRLHRCPTCGSVFDDETHYRWWIMWYQLWLAERAVHASTLFALRGDARHADFRARPFWHARSAIRVSEQGQRARSDRCLQHIPSRSGSTVAVASISSRPRAPSTLTRLSASLREESSKLAPSRARRGCRIVRSGTTRAPRCLTSSHGRLDESALRAHPGSSAT